MENCTPITECLACGSTDLIPTLDFGAQPLANNFRDTAMTLYEKRYPLAINRCQDCDHLQLTHAVDPKLIYTHYLYVSGTSGTYLEYMKWYAKFVLETYNTYTTKMGPYSVLDIGCNDGSQLNAFKELTFRTFGVDPAENLWPTSSANHTVVCGFWDKTSADHLGRKFDIISSQNAFAHNPNPLAYLQLAKEYLNDDGKIFISTSQADMVLNGEFDTIYHEHISYYNANSMRELATRAGLYLIDVIKTPIHGTSYIFVLSAKPANSERVENIIAMEAAAGLVSGSTYRKWASQTSQILQGIRVTVDAYKDKQYKIVGYGAAAKGMTLLNASRIQLDCVVDDNPLKVGLWCPGTSIPVVSIDYIKQLSAQDKVVFIPLAWNFYKEIKNKIVGIRSNPSDVFMRYFPTIQFETIQPHDHQH